MSFINHNELANLTDKCVLNISWSLIFLTLVPTLSHTSLQPWLIKREKILCIYLKNWWNSLAKATSQITSTWNFKLIFQRFVLLSWNFEEIWNYVFCFFNFFTGRLKFPYRKIESWQELWERVWGNNTLGVVLGQPWTHTSTYGFCIWVTCSTKWAAQ